MKDMVIVGIIAGININLIQHYTNHWCIALAGGLSFVVICAILVQISDNLENK